MPMWHLRATARWRLLHKCVPLQGGQMVRRSDLSSTFLKGGYIGEYIYIYRGEL